MAVPSSIKDCSANDLIAIGHVFASGFNRYQARVYLASKMADKLYRYNESLSSTLKILARKSRQSKLDVSTSRRLEDLLFETNSNRHYLAMLTNWFDEDHLTDRWIIGNLTLRKNLLLRIRVVGPSFRFGNVEFWEWCKAETYFARYCQSGKRSDFNLFAACLFRKQTGKNGLREPFNDDSKVIQNHAKWFNRLEEEQVLAIRINYIAIKRWLATVFPNVFKGNSANEEGTETDFTELLLRAARAQSMDEVVVGKKPLLIELKKLELSARDYIASKPSDL